MYRKNIREIHSEIGFGNLKLNNRIVMSPMGTHLADDNGFVSDRLIGYYEKRASGGTGLIIIEQSSVSTSGVSHDKQLRIYDDKYIFGFKKLIDKIHVHGTKVIVQLNHAGRQTLAEYTGGTTYAPSAIPCPLLKVVPKALTIEEIERIIEDFRDAAVRVKKAGAEGVELQLGHGYLLCQFLSPFTNIRQDEYGVNLKGRFLIVKQIIERIKEAVGSEFSIICRISADEMVENGITIDDTLVYVRMLEECSIDALDVSACNYASFHYNIPNYYLGDSPFLKYALEIRKSIRIPIILVGKIHEPELISNILESGAVDMIGIGRQLIADPEFVKKLDINDNRLVRKCLCCNKCFESIKYEGLQCTINPEVGYEYLLEKFVCHTKEEKVAVIGAGPAGLSAAYYLQNIGYKVTVFEKDELGGKLRLAAKTFPLKRIEHWIDYMIEQVLKAGVKINTGREITSEEVANMNYEHIIIATGSEPKLPDEIKISSNKIISYKDAFTRVNELGERIVVIGAGPEGAEIAEYFIRNRKKVIVIDKKREIGFGLPSSVRFFLDKRVREGAWKLYLRSKLLEINNELIKLEQMKNEIQISEFDHILFSCGSKVDNRFDKLISSDIRVKVIGDANIPLDAKQACSDGFKISLEGLV